MIIKSDIIINTYQIQKVEGCLICMINVPVELIELLDIHDGDIIEYTFRKVEKIKGE